VNGKQTHLSLVRIALGVGLVVIGIVVLGIEFNPKGLLIPVENPLFLLVAFFIALIIGYPLKMFLKVMLGFTLWTFLFFFPIWMSPLPQDAKNIILPLSLLLIAVLTGKYEKSKKKDKQSTP
jgi:hypothetical protein